MRHRAMTMAAALLVTGATQAQAPVAPARAPRLERPATEELDTAALDARRAAAGRLLTVSRFRERQGVLVGDGLRAAQADLTTECIDRATAGRSLDGCRATAEPDARTAARLAARRSTMLDEVMAASQTVYAGHFTAPEMDAIADFFRTPVGRKYGATYPQILTEVQTRKRAILRRYLVDAARDSGRGSGRESGRDAGRENGRDGGRDSGT